MKLAVCVLCLVAVASADFVPYPRLYPYFPYPNYGYHGGDEVYAASLGGAKVGLYGKQTGPYGYGFPRFPRYPFGGFSEVTAASLGGANVGLYGKERL